MFVRFLKNTLLFIVVASTAFSSLPAAVFEGGLRVALKDHNVVDRIWLASSDTNVVDRLVPFQHIIDRLRVGTAQAVATGDGKIFYSIAANTTPRTRDYINSTNSFNVAATTVVGGTALQSEIKASPTQNEMVAGYVSSAGTLQVMCWNGLSWVNEWSVAVGGTGTTRRFDIAYETSSGDVMVLYSTNTVTTNELSYRTKLGSSTCGAANWSGATALNPIRTAGIVQWVKLAWDRRAASNLITAIWADASADLSAMVWSGTAWGNEPTAALETSLEIVAVGQDVESFDVEYESLSGDVMIVRGSGGANGTNGGFFSTCTGGVAACTWTARTAMPSILDDTTHLDISANPNTDQILFGAIGNSGGDLSQGVWSGTAWTNVANADTSVMTPLAGTMFVATGWLISGANARGVLAYYDSSGNTTRLSWNTLSGTTWTAQTDFSVSPAFGVQKNFSIEMDPTNKDRLILTVNDANSDIHAKRLVLTGTTFAWTNSVGGNPVEVNTASNVYKTFDFAYNRYIPVTPTVINYTNSTEGALNYTAACIGCGARIGGGAGFRQSITITGTNFGTVTAGNRSTALNNIMVGTHQIADANITAWSPVSITFLTDSSVLGDMDSDWGAQYGGAAALRVTAGGITSVGTNFYVFPQVTSITQPVGFSADTAREYDAGDSDGVITLNGTRFGTSQGSGVVSVLGQSSLINTWTSTAIQAQVSPAITDSVNTGSIAMTQGLDASGLTDTYVNTIRILPRITGFTPPSAPEGDAVTINGNHFCQGVSCPVAFDANNMVTFTSAKDATVLTTWSASSITTQVPMGAVTGDVLVISNTQSSNLSPFSVTSLVPGATTNLNQWKDAALSQSIAIGGVANAVPIYLTMTVENTVATGGTMYPQVEYKPIYTAFVCTTSTPCASAVEGGAAGAAPGPIDCSVVGNGCSIAISPSVDDIYHWQARMRYHYGATDYFGPWTSFDGANPETSTDFQIDTAPPVITFPGGDTCAGAVSNLGTNSAQIDWTVSETSTGQIEYSTDPNLAGSTLLPIPASPSAFSHTVTLSNLNSGATYYFKVKSLDTATNIGTRPTVSPYCSFTTSSNLSPAKTIKSYINGAIGAISSAVTYYFTVNVPETTPSMQNVYLEVFGVASGGSGTIAVQANGAPSQSYSVSAVAPTLYKLMYKIPSPGSEANLNLNDVAPCTNGALAGLPLVSTPPCNVLSVTPTGVNIYVLSTKIITTYTYTP